MNSHHDEIRPEERSTADAIAILRNQIAGNNENLGFEPIYSTAIGGERKGFSFVDPIIEPWFAPDWLSLEEIISDLSNQELLSDYDRYYNRFWLDFYINRKKGVERCPEILNAAKAFREVTLMDAGSIERASSFFPSETIQWLIDNSSSIGIYESKELRCALDALCALMKNDYISIKEQ